MGLEGYEKELGRRMGDEGAEGYPVGEAKREESSATEFAAADEAEQEEAMTDVRVFPPRV
jgi:hypothetical protein